VLHTYGIIQVNAVLEHVAAHSRYVEAQARAT
jgi:hypothetical protein